MSDLERRTLLRAGAATLLAAPFAGFVAPAALADPPGLGRGSLRPTRDLRDGAPRLALPPGFLYRSFQPTGDPLGDHGSVPGMPSGMGAFRSRRGGTNVALVRGHELGGTGSPLTSVGPVYDPAAPGGTTTVVVTGTGDVRESWVSLAGTQTNGSGGRTPWGSWVTCERTVDGFDVLDDDTSGQSPADAYTVNAALTKRHGFLFEVPADATSDARPVSAAGRFRHEAVAYAPEEGAFYLTEDGLGFPSGFYRYEPPSDPRRSRRLEDGGRLWMLALSGRHNRHLERQLRVGTTYEVAWVRIEDAAPDFPMFGGRPTTTDEQAAQHVARQGWAERGAFFGRLAGATYQDGRVYFTAQQGGGRAEEWEPGDAGVPGGFGNGTGQIWAYDVRRKRLELVHQAPAGGRGRLPSNLATSARGQLVVCEDAGNGGWLQGLTADGEMFEVAREVMPAAQGDSTTDVGGGAFAGPTFSPDGRTLFVNIRAVQGMSVAIWGPWERLGV
ncbi:MAG: alkaline phosphatase PhoX [Actinomycetes bacterium]